MAEFSVNIEDYLFELSKDLQTETYKHSKYVEFYICDPKRRHIHKASVIDRFLHHAIFRIIEPIYDKKFIFDSYSSRHSKGIHKAHKRFHSFAWKLSQNNTRTVWVLKCNIKKFFDSVDHDILIQILIKTIYDDKVISLLQNIIKSFETKSKKGIPLGNLTSQLFSNVYLDVFDQYIKRELRIKHYIRYADDFVFLDPDKDNLSKLLPIITEFLEKRLSLSMHPNKVYIRKFSQGIDFLGYVIFPHHSVLRTKTKRRILKKIRILKYSLDKNLISKEFFEQVMASYHGLLKHCMGKGLKKKILLL
ncbi:MAG: reverse transcriptase domain-containing protein [Candidatus Taylorbacteria bacterium]|nr:reverse transcriptase domain-containing protein [Candidatus Taylorbacteria bacterium]